MKGKNLAVRAHPLVFGVVLFLASELMFFAALFAAYYDLRANNPVWPSPGIRLDVVESSIGTGMLAASSGTAFLMTRFLARNAFARARIALGVTIVLALVFLAIAMHGWATATFRLGTDAYGSVFFTMTGFHALHVLAGIIMLAYLFFGVKMPAFRRDQRAGAEAISYYWHFVFVVWVGIWGTIYFVR